MEVVLKQKNATEQNIELKSNLYGVLSRDNQALLSLFQENSSFDQAYDNNNHPLFIQRQSNEVLFIQDAVDHLFKQDTLEHELVYFNQVFQLSIENAEKKFLYALELVGLSKEIFYQSISSFSNSEKKLVHIAFTLYRNPKILILEEPFRFLDQNAKKRLIKLFKKMANERGRFVFLCLNNVNTLYSLCDCFLLLDQGKWQVFQNANDLFEIDQLKRMNIAIPSITLFSDKAIKNKKVHLGYHRDIRDLIKDIYKHVEI